MVLLLHSGTDPEDGFVAPFEVRGKRVNAFSEREQDVKHLRREGIRIPRVLFGPVALDGLQFREPGGKCVAKLLDEPERLLEVSQLVHQINLRQVVHALAMQFQPVFEPLAQDAVACRRDLINAAAGPALRWRLAAAEQALAFEPLQGGIDLAELGGPKIVETFVEDGFQVVAAGGFAEQAEQDVFETHGVTI
jgi:hypothetical protein